MYRSHHAWMFLLIPGVFLVVFTLLPAIGALGLSFTNYSIFAPVEWMGLKNYARILRDGEFWSAIRVTIYYWLLVTPALVVLPVFLAILVNRDVPGIAVYRLIYYFPVLVSVVVTAMLWKWMFQTDGIINYLLSLFGAAPKSWLTSKNLVIPSLAIVTIWQGLGYYMLFYLSGLQSIPSDLYEAADIEGANFWQSHWHITFPLLRPVIFFVAVVSTMSAFKEFTLMLTMTNGGPIGASTTVVFLVYEKAFGELKMGYASAISCILFLIILFITILNQRILEDDNSV